MIGLWLIWHLVGVYPTSPCIKLQTYRQGMADIPVVRKEYSNEKNSKIVAWTALQFPWKEEGRNPDAEAKAMINSHDLPPMIKGMDQEGMIEFFTCLSFAGQYGYDMENDYRKHSSCLELSRGF